MALPSSGQISISSSVHSASTQVSFETSQSGKAINYSLSRLSRGDFGIPSVESYTGINQNSTSKPNRNTQHALSEFHSYNHTQNGSCSGTSFTDVLSDDCDLRYSYHRVEATGASGDIVVITVVRAGRGFSSVNATYGIYTEYPFDTYGNLVGAPIYGGDRPFSTSTDTYSYTLSGTSQIFHIVCKNSTNNCA
jgi:hypothetical protein